MNSILSISFHAPVSVWSKRDLRSLQEQAEEFLELSPYRVYRSLEYVTRDKDEEYFDEIMEEKDYIMEKYVKDDYGSPQNPINGRLQGLFFRANVDWKTGVPFDNSPFGNYRLQVPATRHITPDKNLYVADFYCMYKRGQTVQCNKHNITLVLCERGSQSDRFCHKRLPKLDIHDNEFLFINDSNDEIYVANGRGEYGVYVEILYTEDIDISPWLSYFEDVEQFVRGRDPNPRKNENCEHCNLP